VEGKLKHHAEMEALLRGELDAMMQRAQTLGQERDQVLMAVQRLQVDCTQLNDEVLI